MRTNLDGIHVTVVGDSMLDRYMIGTFTRWSQESVGCPTYRQGSIERRLGAAANVAANVIALGARASLVTMTGDDIPGQKIRVMCHDTGIALTALKDLPLTTIKSRYMVEGNQMFRWDQENGPGAVGNRRALADMLWRVIETYDSDVVILSDYAKGFFSPDPYDQVNDLIRHDIRDRCRVFADPKPANVDGYAAHYYTPNEVEALQILGAEVEYRAVHGRALSEALGGAVAVTRGGRGVEAFSDAVSSGGAFPARCREPLCVVGAGDTFIAALAVAMAAGEEFYAACGIANVAAGIAVSKPYTAVVTREELDRAIAEERLPRSDTRLASVEADRGDPRDVEERPRESVGPTA